ncbi:DUF1456 family protein [Plebeiibacterium marinum]|uniref:DUF1456 family protein n=1 Tax=Plebeiibacterium marinum TaxID=2992111 RepID=A0AAE3SKR9_9BACT|nr:DUF1456 family protein [Plebeiobacterium marinum]MCW3806917.1 DUF1456 family protein [Plebeiobacterium marinum]
MNNNDVFRNLRYIFDFDDNKMMKLFSLGNKAVTRAQISDWLKKEDHESYKTIVDENLSAFLNGLIVLNRGAQDGSPAVNEKRLNNNQIMRKLKIALQLKDEDLIEILSLIDFKISKHELSAFFRKPGHNHYRVCKDQILRKFIFGLRAKYRP